MAEQRLRLIQGVCQVETDEDTYVHEFDSLANLLQWLREFNVTLTEVMDAFSAEAD